MRPNLLLVIVDDLRSDRLGFAGLERAETPFLDSVAARGVRFTRCFSTAGWTLPACASIVTGLHPSEHGLIHHDRRFDAPKIPARLGAGYASFGVGNNGNLVPDDIPEETLESLGFERRPHTLRDVGHGEPLEVAQEQRLPVRLGQIDDGRRNFRVQIGTRGELGGIGTGGRAPTCHERFAPPAPPGCAPTLSRYVACDGAEPTAG